MIAFKRAFAARAKHISGEMSMRVCASLDHIALTPILSHILPPFF